MSEMNEMDEYTRLLRERYPHLFEAVKQSSEYNEPFLAFSFGEHPVVVLNISDPVRLAAPLTELMNDQIRRNHEDPASVNSIAGVVTYALVTSVMNHFKSMDLMNNNEKFNNFLKGNLEGLSEEEINRFIDMKLNMKKVPLWYGTHDQYTTLSSTDKDLLFSVISDLDLFNFKFQYLLGKFMIITTDNLQFEDVQGIINGPNFNGSLVNLFDTRLSHESDKLSTKD